MYASCYTYSVSCNYRQLCFYTRLSFCPQGGGVACSGGGVPGPWGGGVPARGVGGGLVLGGAWWRPP